MSKPNIILIITHDTGQHLGCYGVPNIPTPNLNRLAQEGMLFSNAFCTSPLCSPSRGSLVTGRYPHSNGLIGLAHRGWNLNSSEKVLAEILYENGYETFLFGLQHETRDSKVLSKWYEHIYQAESNSAEHVAPIVAEFLLQRSSSRNNRPFFAMIGFIETHRPYERYTPVDPEKVYVLPYLPDTLEVRNDLAMFYGSIRAADLGIGRILEALDKTYFKDNTIVIYTTDHGIPFPRAKSTLYDPGIKIALLIRWPALFSGPKVCDQLVSNIDILPTLLDIIGARISDKIQGRSFLSILKGERSDFRKEVFAEKTYHNAYDPIRCIRTSQYKYIKNFSKLERAFEVPRDIELSLSAQVLGAEYYTPRPEEEFYDLQKDPLEKINLINDPAYTHIISELRSCLMKWLEETNDPILYGDIPPTPEQYK